MQITRFSKNTDAIQRKIKSWDYICCDLPDEFIVTTDKRKRVVGERHRFKSKPKSRSVTTLGMKICKMTRDPVLCSQSRLSPCETGCSGGAVPVTRPQGELGVGGRAEWQHHSCTQSSPPCQDSNTHRALLWSNQEKKYI